MSEGSIRPYYEKRTPSPQTVTDLFRGSWKSALPGNIASGEAAMFDDSRPRWAASQIEGGFAAKSILELGPFEAYQTYLLLKEGAREVVSVEANSINFLKCLCVKEIYGLNTAQFLFGDILNFVHECRRRYDVVWASGMLYHLQDPVYFIERVADLADYIYVWTHYFDNAIIGTLSNGQERHFQPCHDKVRRIDGRNILLHARSYLIPDYNRDLPMYWEGGLADITYWLSKEDLFWLFKRSGMAIKSVESTNTTVNGLPAVGFLASSIQNK